MNTIKLNYIKIMKLNYARLRLANKLFHLTIPNKLDNHKQVKRAIDQRKKYFQRLNKDPFFASLLKHRKTFYENANGKAKKFELILTGAKEINIWPHKHDFGAVPMQVAFIIDPLGRVRIFAKPNIDTLRYNWEEYRGFEKEMAFDNCVKSKARVIYSSDIPEENAIVNALRTYEKEMTFSKNFDVDDLIRVQKLM